MLQFDGNWRYDSPGALNSQGIDEFRKLINRICGQGRRWTILEHFKRHFASAAERDYVASSSEDWASSDLDRDMSEAAENAPLFIEAFFRACAELKRTHPGMALPDVARLNRILADADAGFQIDFPSLIATREHLAISVPEQTPSLEHKARELIDEALSTSDQLLNEGSGRRAVQEILWLLETVSTAFRGEEVLDGNIQGTYFNKIISELRRHGGGHQEHILRCMIALHGYLSAPKGGGVRHGVDLKEGLELSGNEARLYCNLIRSYLVYLIAEHERLIRGPS